MNKIDYLLTCIMEEAAEVIQVASKVKRFGPLHYKPDDPQGPCNLIRMFYEYNDLIATMKVFIELVHCHPDWGYAKEHIKEKKQKLENMMIMSRNLGTLTDEVTDNWKFGINR